MRPCRSLVDVIAAVPAVRCARGTRHPLAGVLLLASAATLCGMRSYSEMAAWGHTARGVDPALLPRLGLGRPCRPSAATLHRVKDVKLGEGQSIVHTGRGPTVLAFLPAARGRRRHPADRRPPARARARPRPGPRTRPCSAASPLSRISPACPGGVPMGSQRYRRPFQVAPRPLAMRQAESAAMAASSATPSGYSRA